MTATDVMLEPIRRIANGRQFAVATWHPDAGRVDPETWWLAFREGVQYAWTSSAKLSGYLRMAAEVTLLLGQRECPHCGYPLDEVTTPPEASAVGRGNGGQEPAAVVQSAAASSAADQEDVF